MHRVEDIDFINANNLKNRAHKLPYSYIEKFMIRHKKGVGPKIPHL